jgi:hypothetical protein
MGCSTQIQTTPVIDSGRRPLNVGRCAHCGHPLQTTWYVDGRADVHCPTHGHQRVYIRRAVEATPTELGDIALALRRAAFSGIGGNANFCRTDMKREIIRR